MEENRRLLILDDEPETLKGYQDFLTPKERAQKRRSSRTAKLPSDSPPILHNNENYEIFPCSSGEEAIQTIKKQVELGEPIAAGFFDVKLGGGIDGIDTVEAIRKIDPKIHCVIVTAYHDRTVEDIHSIFGEEFKDQWDYLNKPFTQGEIVQKARQMVGAWNRHRKLEQMYTQLIRSEKLAAVGQVARGVGHEFGNILLRIMGKADIALVEKDPSKMKEHLEVIIKASERAGVIVKNLQSFSRSGPNFRKTNLPALVDEALSLVNHEYKTSSIQVNKKYESIPEVPLDSGGIAQVLLNFLINARHSMPSGGKVDIQVKEEKKSGKTGVSCTIKDTGIGIPKKILPRIFDFAFTTKGDQGSGLGLAVSKDIVNLHNGKIDVESEEGKGTSFTLWLPTES